MAVAVHRVVQVVVCVAVVVAAEAVSVVEGAPYPGVRGATLHTHTQHMDAVRTRRSVIVPSKRGSLS